MSEFYDSSFNTGPDAMPRTPTPAPSVAASTTPSPLSMTGAENLNWPSNYEFAQKGAATAEKTFRHHYRKLSASAKFEVPPLSPLLPNDHNEFPPSPDNGNVPATPQTTSLHSGASTPNGNVHATPRATSPLSGASTPTPTSHIQNLFGKTQMAPGAGTPPSRVENWLDSSPLATASSPIASSTSTNRIVEFRFENYFASQVSLKEDATWDKYKVVSAPWSRADTRSTQEGEAPSEAVC